MRRLHADHSAASLAVGPEPKTLAAPSCNCAFQSTIGAGCASNSLANSAGIFSILMAASATFASKPAVCVRQVRFVLVSPDPRQRHRCQAANPLIGLSESPRPPRRDPMGPASSVRLAKYVQFPTIYPRARVADVLPVRLHHELACPLSSPRAHTPARLACSHTFPPGAEPCLQARGTVLFHSARWYCELCPDAAPLRGV